MGPTTVTDSLTILTAVLIALLAGYGIHQMITGWQAKRRGGDQRQLLLAGAARLLLSCGVCVPMFLLSDWSSGLGIVGGRVALGISAVLVLLAVFLDVRRRQLTLKATGDGSPS